MIRVSKQSTPIPKGAHAPPRGVASDDGCRGFKTLSTMFLASRLEISSHAAFAEGSNSGMIGITAARYSTILHMLSSIKQQVRVTNFTWSLSPREKAGSNGAKAGDSTYNTTNADCQFFYEIDSVGNRLGSYHVEGEERFEIFVAHTNTEGCLATRSGLLHVLLDVPSLIRCLYKRLQLGVSISTNLYMLATIEQRVCLTDPLCR